MLSPTLLIPWQSGTFGFPVTSWQQERAGQCGPVGSALSPPVGNQQYCRFWRRSFAGRMFSYPKNPIAWFVSTVKKQWKQAAGLVICYCFPRWLCSGRALDQHLWDSTCSLEAAMVFSIGPWCRAAPLTLPGPQSAQPRPGAGRVHSPRR